MNATYEVTPEMLGLTWGRLLMHAVKGGLLGALVGGLVAIIFHGRLSVETIAGAVIVAFLSILPMRPFSQTKLRLTDDSIEELDGPLIPKAAIARVNEYSDENGAGIEIVGDGKPRWLRKYRIFVPAALPEYQDVRRVVEHWTPPQMWHRL